MNATARAFEGGISEWVATFAQLWAGGQSNVEKFMELFSPDVRLIAPGLRPTKGREAGLAAFRRTFHVLPDLTAEVLRWSATGDVLFIEMTFKATIGGRITEWRNVDRFLFRNGLAVERVAFYNPGKIRRAFLSSPSGWMQLLRRLKGGW